MTRKQVQERREQLEDEIGALKSALHELQMTRCRHPKGALTIWPGVCDDCGKPLTIDELRKRGFKIPRRKAV